MLPPMRILTIALVSCVCLLSGCATSRGVVSLATPTSDTPATSKGIEVYIHSVADKRIFEAAPKSPSTPSLDPAEPQSAAIKLRAIARKRNTFGKGLGDILLNEGQTVESVISGSLRQAFIESGYTVVENDVNLSTSSQVVDVQINKFWSWMNPGFWAITLSTEIDTDITVKTANASDSRTIYVKASDTFQTGVEGNWLSVMNQALKDYMSEVKAKVLSPAGAAPSSPASPASSSASPKPILQLAGRWHKVGHADVLLTLNVTGTGQVAWEYEASGSQGLGAYSGLQNFSTYRGSGTGTVTGAIVSLTGLFTAADGVTVNRPLTFALRRDGALLEGTVTGANNVPIPVQFTRERP